MALKAGSKKLASDYVNSMAQAMENAFIAEWPHIMGSEPVPPSSDQMKLLFIAIAQGVVKHLVQNHSSFEIQTSTASSHSHGGSVDQITTTGTLH